LHRSATTERHPAELIEVLEGGANIRSAFFRIQREAEREVRVFDKPPYFNPTGADAFDTNPEEMESLERNRVTYRVIYERSAVELPGRLADIWQGIRAGEQARVADSLPLKLALGDDKVALINSTTDYHNQTAYQVHPSALLDALIQLFEATWHRSVALNQAPPAGDGTDVLTPVRRELVGLLAAGATDETIARSLGLSVRTVQRHVHTLMSELGAETRFQLGMEAVRRNWQ
jgi:DNA-binding CsgD family transcriptional regulator